MVNNTIQNRTVSNVTPTLTKLSGPPPYSYDYGGILLALFGCCIHSLGAYVQLNDPQPFWWILAYSITSLVCFYIFLIKVNYVPKFPLEFVPFLWYVFIIPIALSLRSFNKLYTIVFLTSISNTMDNTKNNLVQYILELEPFRELFGMIFIILWLITILPWGIHYTDHTNTLVIDRTSSIINKTIVSKPIYDNNSDPISFDTNSDNNDTNKLINKKLVEEQVQSTSSSSSSITNYTEDNIKTNNTNTIHHHHKQDTNNNPNTNTIINKEIKNKPFTNPNYSYSSDKCTLLSPPSILAIGTIIIWITWFYALKNNFVQVNSHCQGML